MFPSLKATLGIYLLFCDGEGERAIDTRVSYRVALGARRAASGLVRTPHRELPSPFILYVPAGQTSAHWKAKRIRLRTTFKGYRSKFSGSTLALGWELLQVSTPATYLYTQFRALVRALVRRALLPLE